MTRRTRLIQRLRAVIRVRLGLKPKDGVKSVIDGDLAAFRESTLLKGYGAVQPRSRPENWRKIRAEVERSIAKEAVDEHR